MNLEQYYSFTQQLQGTLEELEGVVGLVALGATAGQSRPPDQWSDHDFFVITRPGGQNRFRHSYDWLPDAERIIFTFQETAHGVKVLYDDCHLVEYAVFDLEELGLARVNDYRVLFDKADATQRLESLRELNGNRKPDTIYLWGQLLTHLLVGTARYSRGERLSGHRFVKHHAVADLLELSAGQASVTERRELDNLDPFRRFENVFPELGERIMETMLLDVPTAAAALLDLALEGLAGCPKDAAASVKEFLNAHGR